MANRGSSRAGGGEHWGLEYAKRGCKGMCNNIQYKIRVPLVILKKKGGMLAAC